ncbi:MAG: alpha/beta hydrolase [Bacilli bacterium]|nr:alpha/beta hydrolase [Bacilli bacterium]
MKYPSFILNILRHRLERINKKWRPLAPTKDFACRLDIPYINDNSVYHSFDVVYGSGEKKDICIIDIHGGAYYFRNTHRDNFFFAAHFAKQGFDFALLDYIPNNGKRGVEDQFQDVLKNIEYIFTHLKELNLENKKFFFAGDSAGGHFALLAYILYINKELQKEFNVELSDIQPLGVLVNSPVYNFAYIGSTLSKGAQKKMFGPNYLKNEKLKRLLSVRTHIDLLKGANIFLSTCKQDFIRQEPMMFKKDLENKGIPFTFVDIDSDKKKIDHVHNVLRPTLPESVIVNEAMVKFLSEKAK